MKSIYNRVTCCISLGAVCITPSAPERSSLHLVLSIHAFTWADLLTSALASLSGEDAAFHEPLPVGFLNGCAWSSALRTPLAALLKQHPRGSTVEAAVEHLARRFIGGMAPLPDGQALRLDNLNRCESGHRHHHTPGDGLLDRQDGQHRQHPLSWQRLTGARRNRARHAFFGRGRRLSRARALPDVLTEQSKVVLVRRLLHEAVLEYT